MASRPGRVVGDLGYLIRNNKLSLGCFYSVVTQVFASRKGGAFYPVLWVEAFTFRDAA
jgi:hypothetical protein